MAEKVEIPGFPGYLVDTNGVVYGRKGNPLKLRSNVDGFEVYEIYPELPGKIKRQITPARCVALAFHGPCEGRHATRIEGKSNHKDNVKWATRSEVKLARRNKV